MNFQSSLFLPFEFFKISETNIFQSTVVRGPVKNKKSKQSGLIIIIELPRDEYFIIVCPQKTRYHRAIIAKANTTKQQPCAKMEKPASSFFQIARVPLYPYGACQDVDIYTLKTKRRNPVRASDCSLSLDSRLRRAVSLTRISYSTQKKSEYNVGVCPRAKERNRPLTYGNLSRFSVPLSCLSDDPNDARTPAVCV